ncbi:juvenile hormone esterase-like [Portunus trituberculatus]|uniref:juvenile hormone esterase-like n=1 Tax=Portunus trituberculatus TaxID=210409 RepID=UPI001E1D0583|nr:juvenile hormone esterase-like [Portunus trituberculatus]
MMLVITMVVALVAFTAAKQPSPLVTLKQGTILGSREKAINDRVYYAFKTIPYAKPPIGPLRLKDPEPAPAWSGVRNGSLPLPKCPQSFIFLMSQYSVTGQEDCLYLNVYTPRPYKSNLPVMVFIHGGAFVFGSAMGSVTPMLPSPLMQKDVVMVAMNYRLGALGFLSTGDNVLPGNLGLKDQTLALQWVQDNINDLGGDPNQVTIFGVSAGGISSHLHILSPSSAGLFQRAILQSGTALFTGVFVPARKGAISISKALNCTGEKSRQLFACFMNASVEDLVHAQSSLTEWYDLPMTVSVQVDGTFLPDYPAVLLKSGRYNKVDVMIGWTRDDGSVITAGLFTKKREQALSQVNKIIEKVGPLLLSLTEEEDPVYLARRIWFQYTSGANLTLDNEADFTNLLTDFAYGIPAMQSAEIHTKTPDKKIFLYRLDHCLEKSYFHVLTNTSIKRKMASHGDDMMYLTQASPHLVPMQRRMDLHMQHIIVTLWTNFASTGNPTINGTLGFRWTPVTPTRPLSYLSLTTSPNMQQVNRVSQDFWNSLPTKNTKILYPERFLQSTDDNEASLSCEQSYPSELPALDSCSRNEL